MRKMKKLMGAAMLAGATIAGVGAANAEVSATISLTSDYVFRGVSQTDNGPAVQGSFDYTQGMFYAGAWGSNVDFGPFGTTHGSMELDAYVGVTPTTGPIDWDLSLVGYFYPNGDDAAFGGEMDYFEGIVGASTKLTEQFTLGAQLAYSPEYFGEVGDSLYYEVNGAFAFNDAVSVSAAWGTQTFDDNGAAGPDWETWNIGGSYAVHGFTFDLRYHDTDISGMDSIVNFTISREL
jgi:uncharacterized protein (TIGR02001 family)